MTPMPYDLQGLDFFPFLSGDNQHYNTSLLAAAAAAVSDDQDLLHSSRFFPYTSSQMFLDQLSAGGSTSLPATNGSSSGSNSSLVSSNSLRESHGHGMAGRSSADTASIFGIIPDIISLD
ncbi:E3 SUMO-protein ligase PIAS1 [Microtus ochrogaster]|uniref:E3 SUMO-protein ligase PIAS1 n=1 Tax=Microtus ochrogaster TaxID=79684 RepID=A0A8J6GDL1_MICOH|nr:E3 SUMO-protein ligase PIAS1 [Microtus ochrogaster]